MKGVKIMGTTFKLEVLFNPTLLSYLAMKRALLMDFEEEFVKEVIVRYKGNVSAAAKDLKTDRKNLYDMIRKNGYMRDSSTVTGWRLSTSS